MGLITLYSVGMGISLKILNFSFFTEPMHWYRPMNRFRLLEESADASVSAKTRIGRSLNKILFCQKVSDRPIILSAEASDDASVRCIGRSDASATAPIEPIELI